MPPLVQQGVETTCLRQRHLVVAMGLLLSLLPTALSLRLKALGPLPEAKALGPLPEAKALASRNPHRRR